jgi:hypothetical protein
VWEKLDKLLADLRASGSDDLRKYLDRREPENNYWAIREWDWIRQTKSLTEAFAQGPRDAPWYALEMFWLRLGGLLFELSEKWPEMEEMAAESDSPMFQILSEYFAARAAVVAALTEEELLIADYMRNRAAHLRPEAYSLKWDHDGKQIRPSGRRLKSAKRSFSAEDIHTILTEVDKMHGDVYGLTFHFARKLLEPIRALVTARKPLSSEEALKAALAEKRARREQAKQTTTGD